MSKGTDFEIHVARLLRSSTGYKNVREQQHICGKNVDIILQKQWNPHKYRTVAVECKNWKSGVDRETIREMYFDYKPLFDKREIDELWIVTPTPVSATVQEHADAFIGLEILHLGELEQDIIDFTLYATFLRDRFINDPLSKYYIPSRIENSKSQLHTKISAWVEARTTKPIAIWAGYGMGKTSYASFLASGLANSYLADSSKRIPILIPLGDYYTSPRLDGLFASTLTRDNGVHGYNFNTFWNLHEAGRFVIILDGFDEMKHAMTKSEFTSISKEIRKLVLPNSKVLLLGRPDAIITGEEHSALTRGKRQFAGVEISDDVSAEFEELRLDFFSKPEYLEFLRRYIACFYKARDAGAYINRRLGEIRALRVEDLIKRPVQARMLAQILLNPRNSIEQISRYDLYNMFIEDCLSREEEKPERRKLERKTRKQFMQDLSWWLWAIKRTRTFTVTDIPSRITGRYVASDQDQLGQLRELLVGSVVEEQSIGSLLNEKDAGTFYFPHLSFTEFLVAEYLIERQLTDDDISTLDQSLDGEIKTFVQGYKDQDGPLKLYNDVRRYRGGLSWQFIEFLAESKTLERDVASLVAKQITSVWQFCVEFLVVLRTLSGKQERAAKEGLDKAIGRAADLVGLDDFRTTIIATQLLLKVLLERKDLRQRTANLTLRAIFRGLSMDKMVTMLRPPFKYRITNETEEFFATLLKHVEYTGTGFRYDARIFFLQACQEITAIYDNSTGRGTVVDVKVSDIRQALRSKHDRDQFDKWLKVQSKNLVFNESSTLRVR